MREVFWNQDREIIYLAISLNQKKIVVDESNEAAAVVDFEINQTLRIEDYCSYSFCRSEYVQDGNSAK